MLSELQVACVCIGEGSVLQSVLPTAQGTREFWLCTHTSRSSSSVFETRFDTCELSEPLSDFYGQPVFVCTQDAGHLER